jgi:hypothetical protein
MGNVSTIGLDIAKSVFQHESGVSDFEALRSAIHARSPNILFDHCRVM